jgi:hypothetical protein
MALTNLEDLRAERYGNDSITRAVLLDADEVPRLPQLRD